MKRTKKQIGLVLLCAVLVILALIMLWRHFALNDLAPFDRVLPVPAVYGMTEGESLARETQIHYSGRMPMEAEDRFVLQNDGAEARSYTVVYPVLPTEQSDPNTVCRLWVNGQSCYDFVSSEEVVYNSADALTPLEDGSWFHKLFPDGPENWQKSTDNGASESANRVRYYVRECTVAPGEQLEIRVSFQNAANGSLRFCASYEEAAVASHALTVSGADTVSVSASFRSGKLSDGTYELDPTQKDASISSRGYKYR